MESRRQKLQTDIGIYNQKIDELKQELMRQQTELDRLKISVEQAQVAQREAVQRNTPELALPKSLFASSIPVQYSSLSRTASQSCKMNTCFDHSRCSLTSGFPVYLYDPDEVSVVNDGFDIDGFLKTSIKQAFGANVHLTSEPKKACVFVLLVGEALSEDEIMRNNRYSLPSENSVQLKMPLNMTNIKKLPYWGGDGRNHILINLSRRDLSTGSSNVFHNQDTGRAMVVQSSYKENQLRHGFDLVVPPILGPPDGDVWQECASMLPARRKYLLTFQGEMKFVNESKELEVDSVNDEEETLNIFIVDHLKEMSNSKSQDKFLLQFECIPATEQKSTARIHDWLMCGTDSSRKSILKDSTFVLLFSPGSREVSSTLLQGRLYEALRSGAIPVILGADKVELPYSETIDWRRLAILLPKARITELHFLLRAIPDVDLLAMRRQGRMIWEKYLSTVQATVDTIVACLRDRLGIPPRAIQPYVSQPIFNASFVPLKSEPPVLDSEPEESLGPIEPPYPSPAYKRNYTALLTQYREAWNDWGDPFHLFPHSPFDPVLPSDAKFFGSQLGFRPIGKGKIKKKQFNSI